MITDFIQITIIGDKIVMCGITTYHKEYVSELIEKCSWTPIHNGAMNETDGILHIIRICEENNEK